MKVCYWTLVVLIANHVAGSSVPWRPDCPSSVDNIFISNPFADDQFYYCMNGVAQPILCPFGSQWNQGLGRCEFNNLAARPRSQPNVELERNSLCPFGEGLTDPFYYIPNENDHQMIVKCLNGYAYILSCPPGQYWNVERNHCGNANERDNTAQAVSIQNQVHPNCSVLSELGSLELMRILKNVGTLYICQLDESHILMVIHRAVVPAVVAPVVMPAMEPVVEPAMKPVVESAINPVMETVVEPVMEPIVVPVVAHVAVLPTETSTNPPTPTTVHPNLPIAMPQCSDPKSSARFGIPGECSAYLQCHQGRAYRINCRIGREWSDVAKDCVETSLAGCSVHSPDINDTAPTTARTETIPTTTSTSTSAQSSTIAPTTCTAATQFLPYPNDCRKYIHCDHGKAIVRTCPHPLFWNRNTSICDWNCE